MAFAAGGAIVNRLRVRCAGIDPLLARVRAGRLLEEAAVQPPAFAPAAILCIRRLVDPRPGVVALHGTERPSPLWTQAVSDAVANLARRAARPAVERVLPDAEAIVFADRAELLACLTADWIDDRAAERWWWRSLFGNVADLAAVLRAWRAAPEHVAAAFEEAARLNVAARFAARLTNQDVHTLLQTVVFQHGLCGLAPTAASLVSGAARRQDSRESRVERSSEAATRSAAGAIPPWRTVVPEADAPSLRVDQQCLLGIVLTLRRRPDYVRSDAFAGQLQRWVGDHTAPASTIASRATPPIPIPESRRQSSGVLPPAAPFAVREIPHRISQTLPLDRHRDSARAGPPSAPDMHAAADEAVAAAIHPVWAPASNHTTSADEPAAVSVDSGRDAVLAAEACAVSPFIYPASIETSVGGVFYLLNVALALGLYGDFTQPAHRGIDLPVWRFAWLCGRHMTPRRFRHDPIWRLLADLAGNRRGGHPREPEWFTRSLLPYVRSRVARGLGTSDSRRAAALLCVHRARVVTSATHVDVFFPLALHPIVIRLSGLDRDPGWIPAADRIVTFHYD